MATQSRVPPSASLSRREQILEASATLFLRYGFKKTSMDDLARAAGLSRQGLYLHFETKEAAFSATCLRLVDETRATHEAALRREDLEISERLLGALEAFHGVFVENSISEHIDELLESADSVVRKRLTEVEAQFIADLAEVLRRSGTAASWVPLSISARDLAEHLHAVSLGLKHSSKTRAVYRLRLRTAIKMVTAERS